MIPPAATQARGARGPGCTARTSFSSTIASRLAGGLVVVAAIVQLRRRRI